jgi:hypothetical protein
MCGRVFTAEISLFRLSNTAQKFIVIPIQVLVVTDRRNSTAGLWWKARHTTYNRSRDCTKPAVTSSESKSDKQHSSKEMVAAKECILWKS